MGNKTPQDTVKFCIVFSMPFWIDFWSILPPNMAPKIDQNRKKIDVRMHPILDSIFGSIFDWLSLPTCDPESQLNTSPLVFSWFFRFSGGFDFWSFFGANLPPFSFPKSTKIFSKIDFRRHRFFDRFWHRYLHRFGSILGSNLGPCWPLFRSRRGDWI